MATKHTSTSLKKAGDDEPIFVLRAQDIMAPTLIRQWAEQLKTQKQINRVPTAEWIEKYDGALRTAAAMDEWKKRKLPD
ncbi:MAG TPA: hypothetical protein VM532_12765 [Burkholderiales bacterium]|jgi:hypothetical protein|nr:hypothetical protein [Burkholderiales bacterium]